MSNNYFNYSKILNNMKKKIEYMFSIYLHNETLTSEGFCPVPLLGCDECWDQEVELPAIKRSKSTPAGLH